MMRSKISGPLVLALVLLVVVSSLVPVALADVPNITLVGTATSTKYPVASYSVTLTVAFALKPVDGGKCGDNGFSGICIVTVIGYSSQFPLSSITIGTTTFKIVGGSGILRTSGNTLSLSIGMRTTNGIVNLRASADLGTGLVEGSGFAVFSPLIIPAVISTPLVGCYALSFPPQSLF